MAVTDEKRQASVEGTPASSPSGDAAVPYAVEEAYSAPLHRKLKSRHLQMIAIGGIIGPGLFVGSGNALHLAGPGGIIISFSLVGIIVFFVMQSLGELATLIPVTGSFTEYAARFVDDSLSFALGWAYWYLWVTVLANEYNAISLRGRYRSPQNRLHLLAQALVIPFSPRGYPLYELLIIVNIAGAFADSINGVANTFVIAGTLYAGTEMVGITSGESSNPRRAVPRAIRQVFWRILIFYVGMMFFIGILIPWNDKRLLAKASKTAQSPLTIALSDAGINAGASLINAVIVIAVISAGNSSLYVSSRTILFMARNGKAPKIFGRVTRTGVPWVALLLSNLVACISFLSVSDAAGTVYNALITLSGVATFIVWGTIELTHIRFRNGLAAQNEPLSTLPFKAMWYPYGTYAALGANIFLIFFQGYTAFLNPFSATDLVINYILLPVFLILLVGYKFWKRTKWVKLEEMDLWTGRRVEGIGAVDEETVQKKGGIVKRAKNVIVG
ncbi:MAG: hypothetical protein Q9191_006877 [Dirinaria sp. TL-2023a]